jgi:uncharacterized membrane protein
MAGDPSLNGWNQFKTKGRKAEFKHDLTGLKQAIWVIATLWVKVYLSCVFILEQATVSILVKSVTQLFFYSVLATSHHKRRILNVRRTIGCNIRRPTDERISNMARVPN